MNLTVADIDSDRKLLAIRQSKGAKDRYVPLPQATLELLRQYWQQHHHPKLLFPGRPAPGQPWQDVLKPMDASVVQKAMKQAIQARGLQKAATVHTLRHSWATHLLESGVNLRHRSIIYANRVRRLAHSVLPCLATGVFVACYFAGDTRFPFELWVAWQRGLFFHPFLGAMTLLSVVSPQQRTR